MEIKNIKKEIIFRTDKENIKDTVEDAVKRDADLSYAKLRGANLSYADLSGADLSYADLSGADLSGANLRGAYLIGANLGGADLSGADLIGANLRGADLRGAKLRGAYLIDANLSYADLSGANLNYANLSCANISCANLRDADLRGANIRGANLIGANLIDAKNIPFVPIACPSDGEFTGWKKVHGKLIELRIPADAKKSSATNDKCRCDKALVVSITDIKTGQEINEIVNHNYTDTTYRVGETVYSDSFDDNRWVECSHGIHFFIDKESAINY